MPAKATPLTIDRLKNIDLAKVTFTPEEQKLLMEKQAAFDKMVSQPLVAKYKMELRFTKPRNAGTTLGVLNFWLNGAGRGSIHGDQKLYFCPGKMRNKSDCEKLLPPNLGGFGYHVCGHCGHSWEGDDVIGEIYANLTMQNWSIVLCKYFAKMDMFADVYLKYSEEEIRKLSALEQEKRHDGKFINKARSRKVVYLWKDLVSDLNSGATLQTRFFSFLTALGLTHAFSLRRIQEPCIQEGAIESFDSVRDRYLVRAW